MTVVVLGDSFVKRLHKYYRLNSIKKRFEAECKNSKN